MTKATRRSGAKIMAGLIVLLGSLSYVMVLAVINGSLGFICAMGITISGAVGIAKLAGLTVPLSYGGIMAAAVILGAVRGILRYAEQYTNHYIAFRLLAVLRDKIFAALRLLSPAKLETKQKGAIISMITADIETLEVFYAHTISPICIAVLVSAVTAGFVAAVSDIRLAAVALAGYIAVGVILPVFFSGRLKEPGVRYRSEFSAFSAYFLDSIKGIKDIVLNNGGEKRLKEVNRRSENMLSYTKTIKKLTAQNSALTEFAVSCFILLTLAVGVWLVSAGQIPAGNMIVGVVTVFASFDPVIAISALPGNLNQTFASGDRVLSLLEEKPAVEPVANGENIDFENLSVEGLNFSYEKNAPILKDIAMNAKKGEIIGIVGPSGCGKSTFLKLLLRFWQKDSGTIAYNGVDIDKINTENLLHNVTMVSQSTYLFDDTLASNLKIARPDATDEQIYSALQKASADSIVSALPDGLNTPAGSLGDNFSAGEKQRLGLARAFLADCPLILLDEPTSNVDSINEGIILSALKKQKEDKCIILVSHRESTMAIADRVYRVREGRMYEERRE